MPHEEVHRARGDDFSVLRSTGAKSHEKVRHGDGRAAEHDGGGAPGERRPDLAVERRPVHEHRRVEEERPCERRAQDIHK